MGSQRAFDNYGRGGRGGSTNASLDDLVEESEMNSSRTTRKSSRNHHDHDEEDELEAYMASIESEAQRQRDKKPKMMSDKGDLALGDDDLGTDQLAPGELDVEDIKADVEAAMSGANSSANKMTEKLGQLSRKSVTYLPFKKNFYLEVPELTKMTKEELDDLRLTLENIKVTGKSCPKPVTLWAYCGLSKKVMEVLKRLNFSSPTPIQAQAIPAIMSGRDALGIAKTGCGKTLSFLLPMFRHILAQPKLERGDGPIGVIITPTRELATQICEDAQKFTKELNLRVVAVYGGPNISEQIGLLKPGAEIIVCTPGRMIEILTVNSGRVTNLNRCTYLVLDEADRLFDMGFEKQIQSIVKLIRPDRQTVMFSATFPKILEAHARKILTDPILIQVGGRSIVCKDVQQNVEIIEEDDKFLRLVQILQSHVDNEHKAIVFVSKQEKADSLLEDLMQAYDPNCLGVLHGGIDSDDRNSTIAKFKGRHIKVLVATSVAARGLDVKNCVCVVNYDSPNHYEDYVHRCGRTGRAGNKGWSYSFITPDQGQYAADIIKALELSGMQVPNDLKKLWDDYKADAERTGKKIWTSSGFSGRGFKFDEAEAQKVNEKKKYQKKSLGMQNSSDEEEETGEVEETREVDTATLESEIKNLTGSRIAKPVIKVISGNANAAKADIPGVPSGGARANAQLEKPTPSQVSAAHVESIKDEKVASKLDLVRQRAAMLCKKKGLNESAPAPTITPVVAVDEQTTRAASKSLATGLSQSIEALKSADPSAVSNTAASAPKERLEMQMEINDYHQQVRRRLTSKETLGRISELCEVGITVRGKFCPPGDRPIEPKLYLAIEGTVQQNMEQAHKELLLVVKDEYNRINSAPATRGRYRIV